MLIVQSVQLHDALQFLNRVVRLSGSATDSSVPTIAGRNLVVSDGRGQIRPNQDSKGWPTTTATSLAANPATTTTAALVVLRPSVAWCESVQSPG